MHSFHGEYETKMDDKARLLLPAALKKQLPAGSNSFMLSRGFEKCLIFYPQTTWDNIVNKLQQLNEFDPKVRQFVRQFLGGASALELDTAGRVLFPAPLKDYAGLTKDIIIAAAIDKFEIWDATSYKNIFDNFSPDEFSNLAKEVMGGML